MSPDVEGPLASSFRGVLQLFRDIAESSSAKGSAFEQLVKGFIEVDKVQSLRFEKVWLWHEYPGRHGRQDTGIDLVAQEREGGGLIAIQCKFYSPDTRITLEHVRGFLSACSTTEFAGGIFVSTTAQWTDNATDALRNRSDRPVVRWGPDVFEQSTIDWTQFVLGGPGSIRRRETRELRPYQQEAVDATISKFSNHGRGKLIMACGSGKTFTALRIAEELVGPGGTVLFLTPSISLLSQSLIDWSNDASIPIKTFAVCSDTKAGRRDSKDEDYSPFDLAEPASTDAKALVDRYSASERERTMTAVFSTYQSLDVINEAQQQGLPRFDLIICDEAHRTTGVSTHRLTLRDESGFRRIHDDEFVAGGKRLYMTATPRIFSDRARRTAADNSLAVASMDDESIYGTEFYRLGFGKAIELGILSDYKVVIFDIDQEQVGIDLDDLLSSGISEVNMDNGARMVGCWNGLRKYGALGVDWGEDWMPAKRAVAFSNTIDQSKLFEGAFNEVIRGCIKAGNELSSGQHLECEVHHVDGTQSALDRKDQIAWLKEEPPKDVCKVLTNARCLTEGIDIPALDAIIFLQPRRSEIDVVQAVGRVMRKSEGKEYGYIILPIARAAGATAHQTLAESSYNAVWQVINAILAHDDRFEAKVNQLRLLIDGGKSDKEDGEDKGDTKDSVPGEENDEHEEPDVVQVELPIIISGTEELRDAILARIVNKYANPRYWEEWATKIREIASRHESRIRALINKPSSDVKPVFDEFVGGLHRNLNDGIEEEDAIRMLSQHLISKPVFDALFSEFGFSQQNQIAVSMQNMIECLHRKGLEKETEGLESLYRDVHLAASGVATLRDKQRLIAQLYERFLKLALPSDLAKSLGIVFTPVPIVDYVLQSVEDVLHDEFGTSMSEPNVHILDPFAGTGTFITRLIESGMIEHDRLPQKYDNDLHSNELNLLAYYIATVNIEASYHDAMGAQDYRPFNGMVLTDTFQSYEPDDGHGSLLFPANASRIERQRELDIRVIIGNPPWSATGTRRYRSIDDRIRQTYASSRKKVALFDPYVRAIRLASDRVLASPAGGVVAVITNGGFIKSGSFDGFRKALAKEFHSVYCFNLRGDATLSGEARKKEGGNVFGAGTRANPAILVLVKKPGPVPETQAQMYYSDIGDYLTSEEKLAKLQDRSIRTTPWSELEPDRHGDWINKRSTDFEQFRALSPNDSGANRLLPHIFCKSSLGIVTSRDHWCYSFSQVKLELNIRKTIDAYNSQVDLVGGSALPNASNDRLTAVRKMVDHDPKRFHWGRENYQDCANGRHYTLDESGFRRALYRPFSRQWVYLNRRLNNSARDFDLIFPSASTDNLGIALVREASSLPFFALMTDLIPDVHLTGDSVYFPRWRYRDGGVEVGNEARVRFSNINEEAVANFRSAYRMRSIDADDVFYFVYAILHSEQYRETFADDFFKVPARIPMAATATDFRRFVDAGVELANLHINYEQVDTYNLDEVQREGHQSDAERAFRVTKMSYGGPKRNPDKTKIVYNSEIELHGIPPKAHEFVLGTRSALDWVLERYQVKTHSKSGIENDPNDWARESGDPRYIIDLVKRVTTVSVRTVDIVANLPELPLRDTST